MKKKIIIVFMCFLSFFVFTGCGNGGSKGDGKDVHKEIKMDGEVSTDLKDYEYKTDKDGIITLTEYIGKAECVVIPKEATYIGEKIFSESKVKKIKINSNIKGNISDLLYNNEAEELYIDIDMKNITDITGMFFRCKNVKTIDLSYSENMGNVTNMSYLFSECSKLVNINFGSNFKTTNVKNTSNMFDGCSSLETIDLSHSMFDTSKVENMGSMFFGCDELKTLNLGDEFNTSSVKNMITMFYCPKLKKLDLGKKFDTRNVEEMHDMFRCESLNELNLGDKFDVEKVKKGKLTRFIFDGCDNLKTITCSNEKTVEYLNELHPNDTIPFKKN